MLVPVFVLDPTGVLDIYDMQGVKYNNPMFTYHKIAAVEDNNPALDTCHLYRMPPALDVYELEKKILSCLSGAPGTPDKLTIDTIKLKIDSTKVSIDATKT